MILSITNSMSVVKVIVWNLEIELFAVCKTLFKLTDCGLKVLRLKIEFLCTNWSILLVPSNCVFKQRFLALHHLHKFLSLSCQSVYVFVWQYDSFDDTACSLARWSLRNVASCATLSCRAPSRASAHSSSISLCSSFLLSNSWNSLRFLLFLLCKLLSYQLVCHHTLLCLFTLQLSLILLNLSLGTFGLCTWSCVTEVQILASPVRIINCCLFNFFTQGLKLFLFPHIAALLSLEECMFSG